MADAKQILLGILSAITSPINQDRVNAEQQLKSLENQAGFFFSKYKNLYYCTIILANHPKGYGVALAQIITDNTVPTPLRQVN
jgi:hypothetical protein